jgi:hypothetical protein
VTERNLQEPAKVASLGMPGNPGAPVFIPGALVLARK